MLPVVDEDGEGFWEGTLAGELRMQACGSCGAMRFPPRPMCPRCQSTERLWQRVSGQATLWSFVVAHPPLLPAYAAIAPYPVVVVSLVEDPRLRLVGNVLDTPDGPINQVDPATLRIGEPLGVVFAPMVGQDGTEIAVPRWLRSSPVNGS
jgi:uncharacterized OB-fold protein